MHPKKNLTLSFLAGIVVFALAVLGTPGCKSSSSPDDDRILFSVTNDCGTNVYIYWNGSFQFSLEQGTQGVIQNVTLGTHNLTAKIDDTDVIVASVTVNIEYPGDYSYTVEGSSLIHITNNYGEILSIKVSGFILGDIADGLTHTLRKVRFGTYEFEARVRGEENIVATASITVDAIDTYSWIITR